MNKKNLKICLKSPYLIHYIRSVIDSSDFVAPAVADISRGELEALSQHRAVLKPVEPGSLNALVFPYAVP